ncbi:MAG: aldo/keto reductase [Acidobacteria bacterium]|nr:MAG: aldo/keto reductase [Acidobacteriota bacterium]
MEFRPLGESGIEASVVGLGAWAIGGWMWGGTDERKSVEAIQASIDAGINFIDTAPAYGMGLSETIVGKAIGDRRQQVVVATKCGIVWHTDKGTPFISQNGRTMHRYLGPESIRYEVEQSLKRLNTGHIDLYQTHWQDQTTPIEETMATLLDLKREGKIRAIGVSNATVEQIEKYRRLGPVDSGQEKYSMLDRGIETGYLPYALKNNIAVLAYSPLAYGLLTGKVAPGRQFPADDIRHNNPRFSEESRKQVLAMLERMRPIAERHDLTLAQLVIAWTVVQPGLTHALVGARNAQQARENAAAGNVTLSREELENLNQIVASQTLAAQR